MSTTKPKEGTYTHPFFKSDTDRGILLKDMMTDNIVTTLINMGGEMWAIRRRMLVMRWGAAGRRQRQQQQQRRQARRLLRGT